MTNQAFDDEDLLMRIAHAQPFTDCDFNIAQILARGLERLPENNGSQDWMHNAVGICLGVIGEQLEWAQARAIARCARPAIKPVCLAERLPGPEHCDAEGQSWWYHPETMSCVACWCYSRGNGTEKHWLPHYALPVPQQEDNR